MMSTRKGVKYLRRSHGSISFTGYCSIFRPRRMRSRPVAIVTGWWRMVNRGPSAPGGMRHGTNDYTGWFAGDANMKVTTAVTTGRVRHGTTRSYITTCLRFMRWIRHT